MKLIDLHKEWMEDLKLPESGLCRVFKYVVAEEPYYNLLELLRPTWEDRERLINENKSSFFWASDSSNWFSTEYNTLRQTIVLLICAMNNEI